ncbi:hypothetical protein U0070_018697 [Myodes glareolus]|uniref:Small ribosomal subunit protein eS6 n=1 Tax=Myodes glareolus TaxID=447135 RepID=A0AAW0IVX5_MYOGA
MKVTCQINNGHIGVKNTEDHVSELPFKLWDDLAHNLGSTSGCRDDVLSNPMAIIPQLPREAIHSLLGDVDYDHESFHNAKDGVDDLVGPDFLHGDDGDEDTSGLRNILGISITPFDVDGMSVLEDADGLPVDCAVELAMGRVILEHIDHVAEVTDGVIDGNNIHFARKKALETHRTIEVATDVLGEEWKGYVFRISSKNDRQGQTYGSKEHPCYRPRRAGERPKSVHRCTADASLSVPTGCSPKALESESFSMSLKMMSANMPSETKNKKSWTKAPTKLKYSSQDTIC